MLNQQEGDTNPGMTSFSSARFVFLDRDGVINRKLPQHHYVTHPDDLVLCPGAGAAIAGLNKQQKTVIVVTNQRGIALGLFSEQQLGIVHQRLHALLQAVGAHLDAIYYCPHAPDSCDCRKPLPGMFQQAFKVFPSASPANSIMVGDSLTDMQAADRLGMPAVFIEGDPATQDAGADQARTLATYSALSLAAFVAAAL